MLHANKQWDSMHLLSIVTQAQNKVVTTVVMVISSYPMSTCPAAG